MTALATLLELENHLGRPFADEAEVKKATSVLDTVSGMARRYCRQTFDYVEDDTIILLGTWDPELRLPQRPVTAVGPIAIDGTTLTADVGYVWLGDHRILRGPRLTGDSDPLPADMRHWGGPTAQIEVSYSHGYETLPPELKGIVLDIAARAITSPAGVVQESVGSYSVTYGRTGSGADLTPGDRARLWPWRHPKAAQS